MIATLPASESIRAARSSIFLDCIFMVGNFRRVIVRSSPIEVRAGGD
jgi:hypothetical protein